MSKIYLVDTDVLIDFLRGHSTAVSFIKKNTVNSILSCIVVAELYAGVRGEKELQVLDEFLSLFRIAPFTTEIAKAGGLYKMKYWKSHGVGLSDAVIAATAEAEGAVVKTLNVKHYPMFKGLKPAYRKD